MPSSIARRKVCQKAALLDRLRWLRLPNPSSPARLAAFPKVALCDDCLWHETDVPSRRTWVIAARSTASAALIGALRITTSRRRHQPMLAWKKADLNRKFTPGQGMEQLKHGIGSRH